MTDEEREAYRKQDEEATRRRLITDVVIKKLDLKIGHFSGFYDSRGFMIIQFFDVSKKYNRVLKVSETGEILLETYSFFEVSEVNPNKNVLAFSEFIDRKDGFVRARYGIINENFEILVPATYRYFHPFYDDYYIVGQNKKSGILSETFQTVLPVEFREIEYSKNLKMFKARKKLNKGKKTVYYIFDAAGILLTELHYGIVEFEGRSEYFRIYDTSSDIGDYYVNESPIIGNIGIMDRYFKVLLPPVYELIFENRKHFIVYQNKSAEAGRSDFNIEEEIPGDARKFYCKGGKFAVVSQENKMLIPLKYNWIEATKDQNLYVVNKAGILYYYQEYQDEGFWDVKDGMWGLVNAKNEMIVEPRYKFCIRFDNSITTITFTNHILPDGMPDEHEENIVIEL